MEWLLILIVLLVIFLLVGLPVPFCFGIIVSILFFTEGISGTMMPSVGFFSISGFTVLSIPFFIYLGDLMSAGGVIKPLIDLSQLMVGRLKGSIGYVAIVTNILFGAITGSGVAAVAGSGSLLFPELKRRGYDVKYSAALISSAGAIGFLIPPSVPLIVYASVVPGSSIEALFAAGIIPGLILAFSFMCVNWVAYKRGKIKPDSMVAETEPSHSKGTVRLALPALMMPVIVLGGIYLGIFAPTEAAAMGCGYAIIVGFLVYRKLKLKNFIEVTKSSGNSIGVILCVLFFLSVFSKVLTMMQVPQRIAAELTDLIQNKYLLLLLIDIMLIVLGMMMDAISGTIVGAPLLLPLVQEIGVSNTHFAIIMCTAFAMGLITPPVAPNIFVAARVTSLNTTEFIKEVLPFLLVFFVVLLLVTYLPCLSEFVPGLLVE